MPYALVIYAFPSTDMPVLHTQGKILHGIFYELLQKASVAKGDEVHDISGLKPFSTTLLLDDRQRRAEKIRAGEELRIRFTFLDDAIYPLLSRYFLTAPALRLELVRTDLTVARILSTPHSNEAWAGCCSFEDIYDQASVEEKLFSFHFVTPTFFKRGGGAAYPDLMVPLPLPELLFGSLLQNWNQFSPLPFPDEALLKDIFAHNLEMMSHRISSQQARLVFPRADGQYRTTGFPGFVGTCHFRLCGSAIGELNKQLNALADLAFFSGIGARTTMGFGMARRIRA